MSFRVTRKKRASRWMAMDGSSTYYIGQIVTYIAAGKAKTNGTVLPLAVPAGVADATNFQIPAGIVVGFNNRVQTTNSTGQYDGGTCVTQAAQLARDWWGQEGMYSKGDPQNLCLVDEITPDTTIEGDIRAAAIGTAITLLTVSASTDTAGMTSATVTTNATQFTPVTLNSTIYCRSGANAGLYRTGLDSSTTAPTVTTAFPYDVAVGDTFVRVPFKQGFSSIYISGPGLWVNCAVEEASTTTFQVICEDLDLGTALKEVIRFRFCADHFSYARL